MTQKRGLVCYWTARDVCYYCNGQVTSHKVQPSRRQHCTMAAPTEQRQIYKYTVRWGEFGRFYSKYWEYFCSADFQVILFTLYDA